MDQNSTGGTDKRNWRERLGIGTKDSVVVAGKDMPKVSGDFKASSAPEAAPTRAAPAPAVRPAPMAPRPAAKPAPGSARPAAPRPPVVSPDALANKLKSQRDAAEKLAEQRVAAAKHRAEAAISPAANGVEKPKFTFADDEPKAAARPAAVAQPASRGAPQVQRTAPPVAQPAAGYINQIAPPRPPLGGAQSVPPRAIPPPPTYPPQTYPQGSAYPQGQPYYPPQPQQYPPGYQPPPQSYAPVPPPGYRPIDPATGYTPPPPFNPQMRPPYQPAGMQPPPRLQVPQQRPPMTGFNTPQPGFGAEPRAKPRLANPTPVRQAPAVAFEEGEEDDIFEQPAPRAQRRTTADEYSQAYREVETGYEDETPRSYTPLILLSLLALAVVAGLLGWWGYNNYIKNGGRLAGTTQNNVPVVAAPEKPAKAAPDATATDNAAAGKATNSSKKLIYDRIVGDREVLGGQLAPSEEQPVQPSNNSAPAQPSAETGAPPADAIPAPAPSTGTGNDGTPLPLPPPPGGANGTQGSLEPLGKGDAGKTDQAMITPAAGSGPAADAPPVPGTQTSAVTTGVSQVAGSAANAAATPAAAGSEVVASKAETSKPAGADSITDTAAAPAPVVKEKKVITKKLATAEVSTKSLGAKPVILVPPSKLALNNKRSSARNEGIVDGTTTATTTSSNGGLYGNSDGQQNRVGDIAAAPLESPKKRKTLLDLFRTDNQAVPPATVSQSNVTPPEPVTPPQQVASAAPRITSPSSSTATGAYVAQLASFKSKSEANAEYSRLAAKHGEIIRRYAPIIEQANVAGSTRYRLNIGPMATSSVASSLCSSLFAAGERDCLVHRQ
jgi:SPOR domain